MTVVIGTAGHIDHGKTTLLHALTGIDADRLPEEQRRGMTIDIGYAHLDLADGTSIDFVDVPGHDALIGNMLVGAGEIDAALLVVAADDGPRAQTLEHLELLDALGIRDGIAVITKADVADAARLADVSRATEELLARTSLAGSPILAVAALNGDGVPAVRSALIALRDRFLYERRGKAAGGPERLAIDRAFTVRGRGTVVTGTLRGGDVRIGDTLRMEPVGIEVRARGLQVHHESVDMAGPGRTAINLTAIDPGLCTRGTVLTRGAGIEVSSRLLIALARPIVLGDVRASNRPSWPPGEGTPVRVHVGTAQVDGVIGRRGRDAVDLPDGRVTAILRLAAPIATFAGDRGVARRPSPGSVVSGFQVLDPIPPRGVSRRRASPDRLAVLAAAVGDADADGAADAVLGLHGLLTPQRTRAVLASLGRGDSGGRGAADERPGLAPDIKMILESAGIALVGDFHRDQPLEPGIPLGAVRSALRTSLRRLATIRREDAGAADAAIETVLDDLTTKGKLAREGDRLRDPARAAGPTLELAAAMDRLEAALNVLAPPALAVAARTAGCPAEGIRMLESAGRIVRVEADLAWATPVFHRLAATALGIARRQSLTPAALRDATGTSRRYVMPLIEDLNRRGILARTPDGHVPGPRAPRAPGEAGAEE